MALNSKHINDNFENVNNLNENLSLKIENNEDRIDDLEAINTAPVGTILAWVPKPEAASESSVSLPEGWLFCNGSLITEGPWTGGRTPDLNSIGAFLRGAPEDLVLEVEESQIEDHVHDDFGHQHDCTASSTANSHYHGYEAAYAHNLGDNTADTEGGITSCAYVSGLGDCGKRMGLRYDKHRDADSANTTVSTNCSLVSSSSGMGGVSSAANSGTETRPINMKVLYIIRVF